LNPHSAHISPFSSIFLIKRSYNSFENQKTPWSEALRSRTLSLICGIWAINPVKNSKKVDNNFGQTVLKALGTQ